MILLWKKSLFVFWPSQKNVTEPNCQKWAKNSTLAKIDIFLTCIENQKWFFCEKNYFQFSFQVKKMSIFAKVEFLAHFWQFGSVTFFWLGQKTKSDYFHKRILVIYWATFFRSPKNRLQYYPKTTLEYFVIASWCGRF